MPDAGKKGFGRALLADAADPWLALTHPAALALRSPHEGLGLLCVEGWFPPGGGQAISPITWRWLLSHHDVLSDLHTPCAPPGKGGLGEGAPHSAATGRAGRRRMTMAGVSPFLPSQHQPCHHPPSQTSPKGLESHHPRRVPGKGGDAQPSGVPSPRLQRGSERS